MAVVIRLTSDDIKRVILAFSGRWERYRSPYGVVRAAEAHDDFEIVAADGTISGSAGDFICIADSTFDCWTDNPFAFNRMHTRVYQGKLDL